LRLIMSFLNLVDRHILVAGGAGGIGSEIASLLALNGAKVTIADRNTNAIESTVQTIRARGPHKEEAAIEGVTVDVSDTTSLEQLFARFTSVPVYGVVNAVGVVGVGTALECPLAEYQRQLEINLFGAIRLARAFVSHAREHSPKELDVIHSVQGSIVYISSIAAQFAIPERDPYCVSKAAGQMFHLNLANETAQFGINVNVVLPGRTDTPSAAERAAASSEAALQMFATQRRPAMIPALSIAKTCAFLLSPDLVGCSGQSIVVAEGADTTYRPSYEALARQQVKG
jgi:2-keto-3-deoxy-L-fuconate dehydrogenase